jgi:hypothetical protein
MPVKQEKGGERELGEASDAREEGKKGWAGIILYVGQTKKRLP